MKQYAIALVLTALLSVPAIAQPPIAFGPPPAIPHQTVLPGPTPSPGPPVPNTGVYGFYKSGGVLVGSNGYFPYDTGAYLMGGTDGLARSMGYYTMQPMAPSGPPMAAPAATGSCGSCSRFHRR